MSVTIVKNNEPEVTFEGAVISTYERNGYHDSDFYAIVYNAEKDLVHSVEYATTRSSTYNNGATVDITDTNLALAEKAAARQAFKRLTFAATIESEQIEVGKTVRFKANFNGRTQPKAKAGEKAQVTTIYENRFTYGSKDYYGDRVPEMIAVVDLSDGRTIKLATDRFEVVNPGQYMPDNLRERANSWARTAARDKNFRGILERGL